MDRRHEAYKRLQGERVDRSDNQIGPSPLMVEGKQTEFWQAVTTEVNRQIRLEELRFLDRLAPSYEVYLQAYSRRQALIAVLAIPETSNAEHP